MIEGLFQPMHLLLILGIALLFFGPKRLPELGKGLGTSIRDFRDAMSGSKADDKAAQLEAPRVAATVTPAPTPMAQVTPVAPAAQAPAAQATAPGSNTPPA
jgi:sec-independent protein translocase protein TatA